MLDTIGTAVIVAVIIVNVSVLVSAAPVRPGTRLPLALIAGAWIGLQIALAMTGQFADAGIRTVPLIGVMVALPIVAALAGTWLVPSFRGAVLGIPMPLLVGLNASRVFGLFFLLLAAEGRLSGPFPQFAGWGDIVTGALALPVALYLSRTAAGSGPITAAWNAFGALDLVLAVVLGVTSTNGAALQLFHDGAGSAAMQTLPWALVPTVLVPLYLIGHGIVFAQLRQRAGHSHQPIRAPKEGPA